MRTVVFVHGGPGLTTVPEERWFGAGLQAAGVPTLFWNEPSRTRPAGPGFSDASAFRHAVDELASALGPIGEPVFVAHSFGVHYVLALPPAVLDRTAHVVLIAPSLDLKRVLGRLIELAAADFSDEEPCKAERLRHLLAASTALFDEPLAEAVQLALSDQRLLTHYWQDRTAMNRFFEVWQEPGASLDVECFVAVLRDLSQAGGADLTHAPPIAAPATLVIGDADPVWDNAAAMRMLPRLFPSIARRTYCGCGHFPHLERPSEFLQLLLETAMRTPGSTGPRP